MPALDTFIILVSAHQLPAASLHGYPPVSTAKAGIDRVRSFASFASLVNSMNIQIDIHAARLIDQNSKTDHLNAAV